MFKNAAMNILLYMHSYVHVFTGLVCLYIFVYVVIILSRILYVCVCVCVCVKFYLRQNEDCSPGDSTLDSLRDCSKEVVGEAENI